jgi:hypothetical protein
VNKSVYSPQGGERSARSPTVPTRLETQVFGVLDPLKHCNFVSVNLLDLALWLFVVEVMQCHASPVSGKPLPEEWSVHSSRQDKKMPFSRALANILILDY